MDITRRQLMVSTAAALATQALAAQGLAGAATRGAGGHTPVTTPNGSTLPFRVIDGWKVFHLTAGVIEHEFTPGLKGRCWGYNGSTPGPTIEAVEGDRVRIFVTNRLPEPTTVHWHGLIVPNGMDGVTGLTQAAIMPGETFKYEFTLRQHGTFMYHPHLDDMTQEGMGMMGMFVIHPRNSSEPVPDRDFVIMLAEWRIDPGSSAPNPTEMTDFNVLTMNSRAYPGTEALVARQGERVRIRFGNLSAMEHHPIHLHGHTFQISQTDGGTIPAELRGLANTVLVPVGSTRVIDFVADNPGDWPMHCHMTHHTMNQMGHRYPNLIGVQPTKEEVAKLRKSFPGFMLMGQNGMEEMMEMSMGSPRNSIAMEGNPDGPFGLIDMGGMFTLLKVRGKVGGDYADPGWYEHPKGTVAAVASDEELRANKIVFPVSTTQPKP